MQTYDIPLHGVTISVQYSDAEAKRLGLSKPAETPAAESATPTATRAPRNKAAKPANKAKTAETK